MKYKRNVYKWIYEVSAKDKAKTFFLTIVQILLGGSGVLGALLLRGLIDEAVDKNGQRFWLYAAAFGALTVLQLTLRAVCRHLHESCRASLENRFKRRLMKTLLYSNFSDVDKTHSGEWMNRITSDTVVLADGISSILPDVSGMAVKLALAVIMLSVLMPKLSLIVLPGGAILILFTLLFRKRLKTLHKGIQERDGSLRMFLTERLSSSVVVRAFGVQKEVLSEAEVKMNAHRDARMKRNAFSNVCNFGFGLAMQGAYFLAAIFCGYGILIKTVSYGTLIAVLQLISQIQSPFANLSGFVPKFYAAIASAERLMEAEGFAVDIDENDITDAVKLYDSLSAVEFSGIDFCYPGDMEPVLRNFGMTVKKGEFVALTGHSGCGKSTVLKLMLSLYAPDSGSIYLDIGDKIKLTAAHRALFSYVPQGNMLMSGSVREVITFGKPCPNDETIWNALKISCADEFVRELENGLDTLLGERGAGLSEGQMQRLAIARAVYSERPIMLLDEATSALDEPTEEKLLSNIRSMTDKTVLTVTHRSRAIEICDKEIHFE